MLDNLTIFTQAGHVLHSKTFTPTLPLQSLLTTLISQSLLSSSTNSARLDLDSHTLRWVQSNDLQLIFVVVYQRVLQLSYIDELLSKVKGSFVLHFGPFCEKLLRLTSGGNNGDANGNQLMINEEDRKEFKEKVQDWDKTFSKMLRELEKNAALNSRRKANNNINNSYSRDPLSEIKLSESETTSNQNGKDHDELEENNNQSKSLEALKARLGTPTKGNKKKSNKNKNNKDEDSSRPNTPGSGTETPTSKKKSSGKEMRRWDGSAPSTGGATLDFSSNGNGNGNEDRQDSKEIEKDWVNKNSLGNITDEGVYEIKDVEGKEEDEEDEDEEEDDDDDDDDEESSPDSKSTSKGGWLSSFTSSSNSETGGIFSRLTSSRSLTSSDLSPALLTMSTHLQSKNVASDVANKVCSSVERSLIGKKLSSFGSIKKEVRLAMEDSVIRILTPRTSTDILLEIRTKRSEIQRNLGGIGIEDSIIKPDPYSITFVGVNGVGKSTNLAKVAFWLLQNKFKVLIAACDTFRSGAVEQLNVHVRNLSQLDVVKTIKSDEINQEDGSSTRIELFQKGYGKDASGIANSALKYGKANGFDVVLIDTAGRMQDNEPLMRSLSKLVSVNNPDKIIFVGEALVGNEAVDQLTKFDKALKDFSGLSNPRGLDGMLLTKFDTIDDKVGTCLTATSVTGLPIYFVGVGQTYTDLRQLRVRHVVDALMRD